MSYYPQYQEWYYPSYDSLPSSYDMPIAPAMTFSSSTGSNASTQSGSSMTSMMMDNGYNTSQPLPAYSDSPYQSTQPLPPTYSSYHFQPTHGEARPSYASSRKEDSTQRTGNRYICVMPGCESTFGRLADLKRHYETVHNSNSTRYDCPKNRCSRKGSHGFTRQDHLTEHLRQYHGVNVPKRTSSKR